MEDMRYISLGRYPTVKILEMKAVETKSVLSACSCCYWWPEEVRGV